MEPPEPGARLPGSTTCHWVDEREEQNMTRCTLILLAVLGMGVFGCSESSNPAVAADPYPGVHQTLDEGMPCGDPLTLPLQFHRNAEVGKLLVYNDESYLTIEFSAADGWLMSETQAAVIGPGEGSRGRLGRLGLRRVPLFDTHRPPVPHYTYWIDLTEMGWEAGDTLYVDARADMLKPCRSGARLRPQTAWAGGPGFPCNLRGKYTQYVIQPCEGGGGGGEDEDGGGDR